MNLLNFFSFLEGAKTLLDPCDSNSALYIVTYVAYRVIRILQIAVPFALIIWGSIDFFKAIIAGDEKEMKAKRKPFIHRLIAAIIVLLLPVIINLIMKSVAKNANTTFGDCWKKVADDRGDPELKTNSDEANNSTTGGWAN